MPQKSQEQAAPQFTEGFVSADGFRLRYLEAGKGAPVVVLHDARGLQPSRLNDLLAQQFRVIAVELPGFSQSPPNERSRSLRELAHTMNEAAAKLGLERYNLAATAFSSRIALWQAIEAPDRIEAMVLISPAAIRPDNWAPPAGTPDELAKLLYAHPEKHSAVSEDPAVAAKHRALTSRLRGPNRDSELEARLPSIKAATLVVFGTRDGVTPPEMGHLYLERIPTCFQVMVYDAGHFIAEERLEALHGVVSDFLERREAFIVSRANTVINP